MTGPEALRARMQGLTGDATPLAGVVADADDPGSHGPVPRVIARSARIDRVSELVERLPDDDLRLIEWVLERLPLAALKATCTRLHEAGREPIDKAKDWSATTPREHVALAALLGAFRDIALVVLGPGGAW